MVSSLLPVKTYQFVPINSYVIAKPLSKKFDLSSSYADSLVSSNTLYIPDTESSEPFAPTNDLPSPLSDSG